MPRSRALPAASAWSWSRIACPCCSPVGTVGELPPRTPGWRGLAAGVLEQTVAAMGVRGDELTAWLGPAISQEHFEVGDEVRAAFVDADPGAADAFVRNARGRWQADLAGLARRRLAALGVTDVSGGQWCTFADRERFFSHRRDGKGGRMAALIWRD